MANRKTLKAVVVTGTRAEYRLLRLLLQRMHADNEIELQLLVSGSHLLSQFGDTYKEVENDSFGSMEKIPIFDSNEVIVGALAVTKALARGIERYAEYLDRIQPDVVVLLGDRYEILAAAEAALLLNIPIAHIHGGELTHGAVDDSIRHAISKMANLHFVATSACRRRVIQLGEAPERVIHVGTLGLEEIKQHSFLSPTQLQQALGFTMLEPMLLITYHPETLSELTALQQISILLSALRKFPKVNCLFTAPNIDAGGTDILNAINEFISENTQQHHFVASLGQRYYFSTLRCVTAVVGNSSSGIIEVPAFNLPTVNIGGRQAGRERACSVIDVPCNDEAIAAGIAKALQWSPNSTNQHPYANKNMASTPSEEILKHLKSFDFTHNHSKIFYDLPPSNATTKIRDPNKGVA